MEQMVTVSVKIPRNLKERIKHSKIKMSKVIREMLEEKMIDEEVNRLKGDIKKHKKIFDKISVEQVVKDIREDRDRGH